MLSAGDIGTVTQGPVSANGYIWYYVHWVNSSQDGWSAAENDSGTVTYLGSTPDRVAAVAHSNSYSKNFSGPQLVTAVAVSAAESNWDPNALGDSNTSLGLWQIHVTVHPEYDVPTLESSLDYQAKAANEISSNGANWKPWTTWWPTDANNNYRPQQAGNGRYKGYIAQARLAASAVDNSVITGIGNSVAATGNVYVRTYPDLGLVSATPRQIGDFGTIIDGATDATYLAYLSSADRYYIWWKIQWSDGQVGWSAEDFLSNRGQAIPSTLFVSVSPSTVQTIDWNQNASFTITVRDQNGNPVSGASLRGNDGMLGADFYFASVTDGNGQYTYQSTVPIGKANALYPFSFYAQKSGYTSSSSITEQTQVNHQSTGVGIVSAFISPATIAPGNLFLIISTLNASQTQGVLVGASIVPAGQSSGYISDPGNDGFSILPGGNDSVSRYFSVPGTIPAGNYDVVYTIWQDNNGDRMIDQGDSVLATKTLAGALTLVNPTRTISLSGNLAFGSVVAGSTATSTLTISNAGNSTLSVGGITLPSGFSGNWAGTIAPGGFANVSITFAPTGGGNYGGSITVNSDATGGTNSIAASGTGTIVPSRVLSLSGDLGFGDRSVGGTFSRTLTIANNGNSALTVSGISYPSGFSGNWTGTIAAGGSVNVNVTFSPVSLGTYGGNIIVSSDETVGANSAPVSGNGIPVLTRVINLSGTLAFGKVAVGTSAQATLTISNSGNATLSVSGITFPSGFSGNWAGTIGAGGVANIPVTFSPTAASNFVGTCTVLSDKTSGGNTAAVSGTGILVGAVAVTITPPAAIAAGAAWQIDGSALQSSGASVTGIAVGTHTLTFLPVSGWLAPIAQTVVIAENQTSTAVGNYVLATVPATTAVPATAITTTSAVLNGKVNANGLNSTVSFMYGPTTALGSTASASPSTVTGSIDTAVSVKLSGLQPGTTYYYQVKGVSAGGTGVSAPLMTFVTPSNVATLAGLVVNGSSLNPSFSSNTTSYSVNVNSGTVSTTVTPYLTDLNATVTVNGLGVTSGNASSPIGLNMGANSISVTATAQDGITTKTYLVSVNRVAVVATMSTLASNGVGTTTATLNGTAVANNATTSLSFDYGTSSAYGANVSASPGTATGTTTTSMSAALTGLKPGTTYYYRAKGVNAAGSAMGSGLTFTTVNNVATLSGLTTNSGALSPYFSGTTSAYTVTVPDPTNSITITPTVNAGSHATVTVGGMATSSGTASAPVGLAYGANVIPVVVVAEDGLTTKTYTITVIRQTGATVNASGATGLTATAGTLNGTVNPNGLSTTVSFNYGTTTAMSSSAVATPNTVGGTITTPVSGRLSGLLPKTTYFYQVKAVSAAGTTISTPVSTFLTPNNVATLSGLVLSSGPLSPAFNSAYTSFTATVSNTTPSITLTPILTDANAKVAINGVIVASGSASDPLNLNVGSNTIDVVVTAQDGLSTKTYAVKVTRTPLLATMNTLAATGVGTTTATFNGAAVANNATTTLSFDYGTSLGFGSTVAAAPSTVTGTTVTGMSATLSGLKPGTTYYFRAKGVNVAGTATATGLSLTTINNTATLSGLKVSAGTLSPYFSSTTAAYTVTVPDATAVLSVTPTVTAGIQATMTVAGNAIASGSASLPIGLAYGPNAIPVVVTAQDGLTTKIYTITVIRQMAPAVVVSGVTALTASGATLTGTVNPNGLSTTVTFNYGTTAAMGSTAYPTPSSVTGTATLPVAAKLFGLQPKTTYFFQVKAVSAAGTTVSTPISTFVTPNNVATLSGLILSSGPLSPAFNSAYGSFTASVGNSVSTVTLTPTLTDPNAKVAVNGMIVTSGSPSIPLNLNVGSNVLAVVVTAQDGLTTKTYTVTVTRTTTAQKTAQHETTAPGKSGAAPEPPAAQDSPTATADASSAASSGAAPVVPIKAQLIGPVANGGTLAAAQVTFSWNAGRGASEYWLTVGRTVGGVEYYDGARGAALRNAVTLPTDGRDIYVTLYSLIGGQWQANNYVFTTADTTKAVLSAPADRVVLKSATVTFDWNAIPQAAEYRLSIGSSPGGNDLYDASEGTALTQDVTVPTDGRELFVTLATSLNGQWQASHNTLFAAGNAGAGDVVPFSALDDAPPSPQPSSSATRPASPSSASSGDTASGQPAMAGISPTPAPIPAELTSPGTQKPLAGGTITFTWGAGVGAGQYWLSVGTTVIATDIYSATQGTSLQATVPVPADGSPLYVTLRSLINGQWQSNQYLYQAALPP
jgi:phosphodiesterase/alkaline phosphatase D-like protein